MFHGCSQVCCGLEKQSWKLANIIFRVLYWFFWQQKLTLFYLSSDTRIIYKILVIQAGVPLYIFIQNLHFSLCNGWHSLGETRCNFGGNLIIPEFLPSSCNPKWQLSSSWQRGFADGCQFLDWKTGWPNSRESYSGLFDVNYYKIVTGCHSWTGWIGETWLWENINTNWCNGLTSITYYIAGLFTKSCSVSNLNWRDGKDLSSGLFHTLRICCFLLKKKKRKIFAFVCICFWDFWFDILIILIILFHADRVYTN